MGCNKIEQLKFCCSLVIASWAENLNYVPQNWGTSKNFEKLKNQPWIVILNPLKISGVQSWISAVQSFSGNEQCWSRLEIILNQSWPALNVSETLTRVAFYQSHSCFLIQAFNETRVPRYFTLSHMLKLLSLCELSFLIVLSFSKILVLWFKHFFCSRCIINVRSKFHRKVTDNIAIPGYIKQFSSFFNFPELDWKVLMESIGKHRKHEYLKN